MKKVFLTIVYVLTAVVLFGNLFFLARDNFVVKIENLPEGEQVSGVASPNGKKMLKLYSVQNSLGTAVRAEVSENGKAARNVYWQVDTDRTDAYWISNDAVIVNGVTVDVSAGDSYDCRGGLSILQEGSIKGDLAEENTP